MIGGGRGEGGREGEREREGGRGRLTGVSIIYQLSPHSFSLSDLA